MTTNDYPPTVYFSVCNLCLRQMTHSLIKQVDYSKTNIYTSMKSLKNSVQLIGRLGNKPEVRLFESGKKMASFSLATNETYYNNKGEKVTDTQWHNIVAWGKKVDVIENYLKKGSEIAMEGKLINRSYEKDGVKKYVTEVNLNELLMMGKKEDTVD